MYTRHSVWIGTFNEKGKLTHGYGAWDTFSFLGTTWAASFWWFFLPEQMGAISASSNPFYLNIDDAAASSVADEATAPETAPVAEAATTPVVGAAAPTEPAPTVPTGDSHTADSTVLQSIANIVDPQSKIDWVGGWTTPRCEFL